MEERKNKFSDRQKEKAFEEIASLEADRKLMESYYPEKAALLQALVADTCDRLDYEGSFIYDEYPDPLQFRLLCRRIFDKASEDEEKPGAWMADLIQVMACQEILRRRTEYRSRRRRFF